MISGSRITSLMIR